jgi:integrase
MPAVAWNAPPVSPTGTAVNVYSRTSESGTSYRAQWRPLRPGGQTSATFPDQREACQFARHARIAGVEEALRVWEERERAGDRGGLHTVAEAWEHYLAHHNSPKDGTLSKYRRRVAVEGSWLEKFAAYPLSSVTRDDVSRWVQARSSQTYRRGKADDAPVVTIAPKTVRNEFTLLSQLMSDCVKRGLIPASPCDNVKLPKAYRTPVEPLTNDEFNALLEALPEWWRPFVETLAATGLRINEATALRWQDVRLPQALLTVSKGYHDAGTNQPEGKQRWRLETPKTPRSVRTIDLSAADVATLTALRDTYKEKRPDGWDVSPGTHVFRAPRGGPVRDNPFREDVWHPARKRAGVRDCTPHDLRHLHASWMLAGGASIEDVSERLGHETVQITYSTYAHLVVSRRQRMVAAVTASMRDVHRTVSRGEIAAADVGSAEPGELEQV